MAPRSRSQSRTAERSWLSTAFLLCAIIVVVLAVNVPAESFTTVALDRNTTADVVEDEEGVIGLDPGTIGGGATRNLTNVTNRFGENATVTVRLKGNSADRGALYVDGVNYGDSATVTGIGSGGGPTVELAVFCNESYVGQSIEYEVLVNGTAASGVAERIANIGRYCIPWRTTADWDGQVAQEGVVHDDFGDHKGSEVELGYDATDPDLTAYWPFDEDTGSTATDVSGNGNDGTIQGATTGIPGTLNTSAYSLSGTGNPGDRVEIPDVINDGEFTISFWFKPGSKNWKATLFDATNGSGSYDKYFTIDGRDDELRWYFEGDSDNDVQITTGTSFNQDQWYHVTATGEFDSNGPHELYIDGSLAGSSSVSVDGKPVLDGPYVGTYTDSYQHGNRDKPFEGDIDEVRIYDTKLNATQARRLARGSSPQSGSEPWNGTLTTDWTSTDGDLDVGSLNLTDVLAVNDTGDTVELVVESDPDNDGTPEEASDPVTATASPGPYPLSGLSTDSDRFRLRINMSTAAIERSPCLASAVLASELDLVTGNTTGCGRTIDRSNAEPVASFTVSPTGPSTSDTIQFDATGSTDPDGTIVSYQWDFDGDGLFEETTTSPTTTHQYTSSGTYDVTLRVIDNRSTQNTTTRSVVVSGSRLIWRSPIDWDSRVDERSVVHADFGDHDAGRLELGLRKDSSGLISYWPLDDPVGTTSIDEVTDNSRNLSITGDPTAESEGVLNTTSYAFDATDDRLEDDDAEDYINGLSAFTTSVWVRSNVTGTNNGVLLGKEPDGTDTGYGLRYDDAGFFGGGDDVIKSGITVDGQTIQVESSNFTQTTGWQHLVLTWKSGEPLRLYVNGTLDDPTYIGDGDGNAGAYSGGYPTGTTSASTKLLVGQGAKINEDRWDGLIDELRLYDQQLNASEVARLYNGTKPTTTEEWNGSLTTGTKTLDAAVDPSTLNLSNVVATIPTGTNATVEVLSDPDGDGTFQERSDPITLQPGVTNYSIPQGTLSTNSSTYRLRIVLNTTDVLVTPSIDELELTTSSDEVSNEAPTAAFTASPATPGVGETVTLDAAGSSDADGTIQSYAWDLDDDGNYDDATGQQVTTSFASPGTKTIGLEVTDDGGLTDTTTESVTVLDLNASFAADCTDLTCTFNGSASGGNTLPAALNASNYTYNSYGGSQDKAGGATVLNDSTVKFTNNTWKVIDYDYTVTSETVIEFDFKSTVEGEIHAIGFDDDLDLEQEGQLFKLYGTQSDGCCPEDYETYDGAAPGWKHYEIPVGQFYTGQYDYLVFATDDDSAEKATSFFRNITIYESSEAGYDYDWEFGDGTTATGRNVTHTYPNNGTYAVNLTVTDFDGQKANATTTVTVTVSPTVVAANVTDAPINDSEAGSSREVTVTFDEAMNTGVAPTVRIDGLTGGELPVSGSYHNATYWNGTVTIPDDDEEATATINVSGAEDQAGNVQSPDPDTSNTFVVDTDTPTTSNLTATNPDGTNITVSFEADQQLTDIAVGIEDSDGNAVTTLTEGDFVESGSGPYTYSATYTVPSEGVYNATLDTAADDAGNDGASGQFDRVLAGTPVEFAVNSGGSGYTAADGTTYQADTGFSGGSTFTTGDSIAGTTDDTLYRSERYGDFTYDVSVPDGKYNVTFKLAEVYWGGDGNGGGDGSRVFDVSLEGTEVVTNLDIHSQVGHDAALDVTRTVNVTDGTLNIAFSTDADDAKSGAILVERVALNTPPTADAGNPSDVSEGGSQTLDGTASSDPDGSITSYSWTITSGPGSLTNAGTATPTYNAPADVNSDRTVTVELTVTDDSGATETDTATFTVTNPSADATAVVSSTKTGASNQRVVFTLENTGSSDVTIRNITVDSADNGGSVGRIANGTRQTGGGPPSYADDGPELRSNRTASLLDNTGFDIGVTQSLDTTSAISDGTRTEYVLAEFRDTTNGGGKEFDPGATVTITIGFADGSEKTVTLSF